MGIVCLGLGSPAFILSESVGTNPIAAAILTLFSAALIFALIKNHRISEYRASIITLSLLNLIIVLLFFLSTKGYLL